MASAKQKAAARRNIKKAQAALKKKYGGGGSKKKNYKKSYSKSKSNPGKSYKNAFTPSNFSKVWAIGGSGIQHGIHIAQGGDPEYYGKQMITTYTGYDFNTNEFKFGELWRGYGGAVNDMIYRKVAKAVGVRAYPTGKPKNMSQFLDYATMYGSTIMHGYANRGDMYEAHRQMYASQFGVDLHQKGFNSWQPMRMLETKGPYIAKKMIFKLLREAGYNI